MNIKLLILILFLYNLKNNVLGFQCMDEGNNPVDWFVVYKLPKIRRETNDVLINNGLSYMYMTSNNNENWVLSKFTINDSDSIIGNTLKGLYSNTQNDRLFILYNDQPPNAPSKSSKGHNKGVILANTKDGLWLIHSVPHFPPINQYSYPQTGLKFGQSFLCISLPLLDNFNEIGKQLQYNQPEIYAQNIPIQFRPEMANLVEAAANKTVSEAPWFRLTKIKSVGGVNFVSFAKSKRFNRDLYEDLVAPGLESDLLVETWVDGSGQRLHSNCSKTFKVMNVEGVSMGSVTFPTTVDHSKWAVSAQSDKNWICIADINRMESQMSRGGGAVCLNNKQVAKDYQNSVSNIEKCDYLSNKIY